MGKIKLKYRKKKRDEKMKKMYKIKSGITLLSLIITIIVIFLLGGVAINITFGKNGIIENTNRVIKQYSDSINEENENLNEIKKKIIQETGE